eukprot:scaffold23156_cov20-Tisochrysis_lutea.AAC.1
MSSHGCCCHVFDEEQGIHLIHAVLHCGPGVLWLAAAAAAAGTAGLMNMEKFPAGHLGQQGPTKDYTPRTTASHPCACQLQLGEANNPGCP